MAEDSDSLLLQDLQNELQCVKQSQADEIARVDSAEQATRDLLSQLRDQLNN